MITTGINVDESVHESVVVELNWTYTPSGKVGHVFILDATRLTMRTRGKSSDVDHIDLHCRLFS